MIMWKIAIMMIIDHVENCDYVDDHDNHDHFENFDDDHGEIQMIMSLNKSFCKKVLSCQGVRGLVYWGPCAHTVFDTAAPELTVY